MTPSAHHDLQALAFVHQHLLDDAPEQRPVDVVEPVWIGYTYPDDSGRTSPAFLNSTGVMYPKVECSLKLLCQCT